jgi:virulence-associated protein VagC
MDVHEAKTFRSGGGIALRLPEGLAVGPGEKMLIEAEGDRLTVRRLGDRKRIVRRLRALLPVLEAIGRPRSEVPQGAPPA